jgi:hypothetical protein
MVAYDGNLGGRLVDGRPYLLAVVTSLLGVGCDHPHNSLSEIANPIITVLGLQIQVNPEEVVRRSSAFARGAAMQVGERNR